MNIESEKTIHSIKAVISDLDGTLLNKEHDLSEYSKMVIKTLTDEGIHFLIATGRHHCDAQNIKNKMGVEAFLITSNGATVANHAGEFIYQAAIEKDVIKGMLSIETPDGVYKNLYQGEHWLMEEEDLVFSTYYKEGDFRYTLCKFEEKMDTPINKMFFTSFDHNKLMPIAEFIKKEYGDYVEVTYSMPECLEIMPKGVNKGIAILDTLKHFNLEPHEVIAFGDALNDLEMLQVVGKGYVMGNATEQLLEKLPDHERIGNNEDDAVAKFIVNLFDLKTKTIDE